MQKSFFIDKHLGVYLSLTCFIFFCTNLLFTKLFFLLNPSRLSNFCLKLCLLPFSLSVTKSLAATFLFFSLDPFTCLNCRVNLNLSLFFSASPPPPLTTNSQVASLETIAKQNDSYNCKRIFSYQSKIYRAHCQQNVKLKNTFLSFLNWIVEFSKKCKNVNFKTQTFFLFWYKMIFIELSRCYMLLVCGCTKMSH